MPRGYAKKKHGVTASRKGKRTIGRWGRWVRKGKISKSGGKFLAGTKRGRRKGFRP